MMARMSAVDRQRHIVSGNVRALMTINHWDGSKAASIAGLSRSAASRRLSCRLPWTIDELTLLAKAGSTTVESLVGKSL